MNHHLKINLIIFLFIITLHQYGNPNNIVSASTSSPSEMDRSHFGYEPWLWGTFRPQIYSGLRTRSTTETVLTGIAWYPAVSTGFSKIRHTSQQDQLAQFGYTHHNGKNFAVQTFNDTESNMLLTTSWIKRNPYEWTMRVTGEKIDTSKRAAVSLLLYAIINDFATTGSSAPSVPLDLLPLSPTQFPIRLSGYTPQLGDLHMTIYNRWDSSFLTTRNPRGSNKLGRVFYESFEPHESWRHVWNIEHSIMKRLQKSWVGNANSDKRNRYPHLANKFNRYSPGHAFQVYFNAPFEIAITWTTRPNNEDTFDWDYSTSNIQQEKKLFETQFSEKFPKTAKKSLQWKDLGLYSLSNLLGGIGYFYGDQVLEKSTAVDSRQQQQENKLYSRLATGGLFTATPCRAFFPRGFLWDEGFHQLIILKWDPLLSMAMLTTWLDGGHMDKDGWLPREMILGTEAAVRVPSEFLPQNPNIANPPVLFFPIHKLVHLIANLPADDQGTGSIDVDSIGGEGVLGKSLDILPSLGESSVFAAHSYDFLSRIYPAAQKYYDWMVRTQDGHKSYLSSFKWHGRTMNHTLASGLDDYPRNDPDFTEEHVDLTSWMAWFSHFMSDLANFLEDHNSAKIYKDNFDTIRSYIETDMFDKKRSRWCDKVNDKFGICPPGYLNLFPFLLVPDIEQKEQWRPLFNEISSPFGLLSLSPKSKYFGTGENYWKGPIWMPINYLALKALWDHSHYSYYYPLKENLVSNVLREYQSTGFLFEQYNPTDGHGQRAKPFTGWTSLILLIMEDVY